jgi:eukaryotic-like serine/threonine-protein kinase
MHESSHQHESSSHQLAAIMFTDVVGYTAMMGDDEDLTLKLLQQNHQMQKSLIEAHQGTFVKELGDGILAYFRSADEAVQCSLEIQEKTKAQDDVTVRIGLHWAEIILADGDIYGDGVNIASRIEGLAEPGGIYMSAFINNQLDAGAFETRLMGVAKLKNVKEKTDVYALLVDGLPEPSSKRFNELANPKKKFAILPTAIAFLFIVVAALLTTKYFDNRANVVAAEASLVQIENLLDLNWRDYSDAFYKAKEVEKYIPDNSKLKELLKQSSVFINITSDPPGADVYIKPYKHPEDSWQYLGKTPVDSVQVPASILRWKLVIDGYEPVMAAGITYTFADYSHLQKTSMYIGKDFHRVLDKIGSIPEGMTRVAGDSLGYGTLPDFFIDRLEVSNRQYKKFMDQGGYDVPGYWQELKLAFDDSPAWRDTLSKFIDKTGIPGPASWENGTYPTGRDNFPVTGINWYEANAYTKFAGKSLPTKDHWGLARGESNMIIKFPQLGGNQIFAPFSNFHGDGPVETGSLQGVTSYGAYDMAGNVREWCWNESVQGRWMRGGAWNDNPYMFGAPSQASPFDRSERNGFRCVLYTKEEEIPETAYVMAKDEFVSLKDNLPEPVSDEQFEVYKAYYDYDKTELFDEIIYRQENKGNWVLEKVEFETAYDNERMVAYLFLPTNAQPPYQSVIYGPGSNVLWQENSDSIGGFFEFKAFLEFFVKSGRVVIFPIIDESFERKVDTPSFFYEGTHQFTSYLTKVVKDYRRCLDYLETRNDFDMEKVAFYGMSMGPIFGAHLTAVDQRIKTNIFYAGGLGPVNRPESNMAYFLPRIKIPTLMINGRFDSIFGSDGILNMYKLIGTPKPYKKLILFDSDHLAPQEDLIRETLAWLDQEFGQVVYIGDVLRL